MSLAATREAIAKAVWNAVQWNGYGSEKIEWPNQRLGGQPIEGRWWRVTIQTGQTQPVTIGGSGQRRTRTPFVVVIQIFLPEKGGTKEAYEIATKLALGTAGLNLQRTAPVTDATVTPNQKVYANWETLGIAPIGMTEGHYQMNLTIPGRADAVDV